MNICPHERGPSFRLTSYFVRSAVRCAIGIVAFALELAVSETRSLAARAVEPSIRATRRAQRTIHRYFGAPGNLFQLFGDHESHARPPQNIWQVPRCLVGVPARHPIVSATRQPLETRYVPDNPSINELRSAD
jgi:hypothetical protein